MAVNRLWQSSGQETGHGDWTRVAVGDSRFILKVDPMEFAELCDKEKS